MQTIDPITEAQNAFESALVTGRLSKERGTSNCVYDLMFMGYDKNGKAQFKNKITREYLQ